MGPSSSRASRRRSPRVARRRRSNQIPGDRKNRKRNGRYRWVARTKSSSPCLSSTRCICTSRARTRSFTGVASASCAHQDVEAGFEAVHVLAQCIDSAKKLLALIARYEVAAFVGQVLGDVRQRRLRGTLAPREREAGELANLVPRDVTDGARQELLQIRSQQPSQLTKTFGDGGISPNLDTSTLERRRRGVC